MIRFAAALLVLALAGSADAASTVYTDRSAWEAAVAGSISVETFDAVPDQIIPEFTGGTIATPNFDIVVSPDVHTTGIVGGVWHGDVHPFIEGFPGSNEFDFHATLSAFGVDIVRVEDSLPLHFTIAGEELLGSVGFFGVVSDAPFSSIRLELNGNFAPRTYTLDNVSFAPVPEPAGLGALAAIGALLATRRRKIRLAE